MLRVVLRLGSKRRYHRLFVDRLIHSLVFTLRTESVIRITNRMFPFDELGLLSPVVPLFQWQFFPEFTQVDAYGTLINTTVLTTYVRTEEHVAVGRTFDLFSSLEDGCLGEQRRVEDGY
jgi:hypothetical protein